MTEETSLPPVTLREEAAVWFARMRGEDAAEHRAEFEAWLARGAMHLAAYNRIGEVFTGAKVLKSRRAWRRRRAIGAASVGAVVALVAAIMVHDRTEPERHRALAQSLSPSVDKPAPFKPFAMQGGGAVVLDVDGMIAPSMVGSARIVRLERGRARFTVPKGASSDRVVAGNDAIRSSGGTFDLWLRPDGSLDAHVLKGNVQIVPAVFVRSAGLVWVPVSLAAGQRYRTAPGGKRLAPSATSRDWPSGVLEYSDTPLRDILEEANRYSAIKIITGDDRLNERRLSGRFLVSDPEQLAHHLALALSLDVDASQPGFLVLRAKK